MNDKITDEKLLPQDGVESEGKRWVHLAFMVASTSQVAPSMDWLLHKTLIDATFFISQPSNQTVKNLNWDILIRKTILHRHSYYRGWITHTLFQEWDVEDRMHYFYVYGNSNSYATLPILFKIL